MTPSLITKHYIGFRFTQRPTAGTAQLFVFCALATDVNQWTGVKTIESSPEGTQRILRPARVSAISRFLTADGRNTIPNAVLLAFLPGAAEFSAIPPCDLSGRDVDNGELPGSEFGLLTFGFDPDAPEHERPALIVDGQHRLRGMAEFSKGHEELPIVCVAIIDATKEEQAFQFVVINNKATRVPTDNVKSIIADLNEGTLQARLLDAGVRYGESSPLLRDADQLEQSPFRALLDWASNRDGTRLVPVASIEVSMRYVDSLYATALGDDLDSRTEFFFAYWRAVQSTYPMIWGREGSVLTKKVVVVALNEFLCARIKVAWEFGLVDIFDSSQVEEFVQSRIVGDIPPEFWTTPWRVRIQDNSNVRAIIVNDLHRVLENRKLKRPWHSELELMALPEGGEE